MCQNFYLSIIVIEKMQFIYNSYISVNILLCDDKIVKTENDKYSNLKIAKF